jgi:hypothetical protein
LELGGDQKKCIKFCGESLEDSLDAKKIVYFQDFKGA